MIIDCISDKQDFFPSGSRWKDSQTNECWEKKEWGWKYIGISKTHIPYLEIEIIDDHEKDIKCP